MRQTLIGIGIGLALAAAAWAGTRTETSFSQFTVCVQGNPLSGGVNHVLVQAGILLDNGDPSRTEGQDVLGQLTAGQKAAAVTFFNSALGVVGAREVITTPSNLPTP